MERLSQRDIDVFLSCLREIYVSSDLNGFTHRVFSMLPKVIPFELVSYNEIDLRRQRPSAVVVGDTRMSNYASEAARIFERHIHEHPVLNHQSKTGDGQALKISDFLTKRQWHSLALYNEFYKKIRGIEHQIAIAFPESRQLMNALALSRSGKDFSERDRFLFNLLRPHIVQAHQNAKVLAQSQRERPEQAIIVLSGKNRVRWATEQARRWVEEYFEPPRRLDRLPESLGRWVEHQRSLLWGGGSIPPPFEPLILKHAAKHLVVRLMLADPEEGSHLLLLQERYAPLSVGSLKALGLTNREAETLVYTALGKTNKEIAVTLRVSPLTVKTHLERAYRKLGAQSRTEALSRALKLLNLLS